VTSFKAPTSEELDHDYLWRCSKNLPERGRIGIFNRSYYEEVLVVKVHKEFLEGQKLPPSLVGKHVWDDRYEDIRNYERYLARNGTLIRKFFLHVSRDEQKKRFLERIEEPEKNWKFSADDVRERGHWDAYMDAYQKMIRETASKAAPWYVVRRTTSGSPPGVAAAVVDALTRSTSTIRRSTTSSSPTSRLRARSYWRRSARRCARAGGRRTACRGRRPRAQA
jgi:polyphosphate kinase 2 (PPK2 family)